MKPLALVALSLGVCAGAASASTSVPRVDAIAQPVPADSLAVACENPQIRDADVQAVLGSHAAYKTSSLRDGLVRAVNDACARNVAGIVVTRRGMQVDWAPALDTDGAVAIALR